MLKLTSLALGILTLISIVPSAQAFPIVIGDNRNSQPEVKVIVNPQSRTEGRREERYEGRNNTSYNNYNYRQEAERRREREARERREAWYRRHHGYSSHGDNYRRDDRGTSYNYHGRH